MSKEEKTSIEVLEDSDLNNDTKDSLAILLKKNLLRKPSGMKVETGEDMQKVIDHLKSGQPVMGIVDTKPAGKPAGKPKKLTQNDITGKEEPVSAQAEPVDEEPPAAAEEQI